VITLLINQAADTGSVEGIKHLIKYKKEPRNDEIKFSIHTSWVILVRAVKVLQSKTHLPVKLKTLNNHPNAQEDINRSTVHLFSHKKISA
jgi:hypothetical protein